MRRVVLAPEDAPWIGRFVDGETRIVGPFPGGRLADGVARRLGAAGLLAWRMRKRLLFDAWVAPFIRGDVDEIVAPSLCALRTFAATPRARHVLVQDLPALRQLHADLDTAAAALPACAFLKNFRAGDEHVVRQEQEYALASTIYLRGRWAKQCAVEAGAGRMKIERLGAPPPPRPLRHDPSAPHVLLAGTTASRFGLEVALAALGRLPGVKLACRRGEGTHLPSLRPPVELVDGAPAPRLRAVVAPAWVESSSPEITAAIAAGIPVVATSRALGWQPPSRGVVEVAPGDDAALASALRALS